MPRFRHVVDRLHAHDWLAVAIELLIVVVGVFLGIEAANWNQARQDRQEERRYLAEITGDLRTDLQTLAFAEKRSTAFDTAADHVLAAFSGSPPAGIPAGRIAVDIHHAGYLFLPRSARKTYDELISTGNLGLIRDSKKKAALADYYATFDSQRQWDALLRQQQGDYWKATAGLLPRPVLREAVRSFDAPQMSEAQLAAILAKARQRPEVVDLLVAMAAHQERVRRDSKDLARMARRLIGELEEGD